jgi:predicted dehydrogenase
MAIGKPPSGPGLSPSVTSTKPLRMNERPPSCAAYTAHQDLLRDPAVEAVDLTLPHHLHYTVARAALEQGKHVLVEKPMAATSQECLELIAIARKNACTFTVAENTRVVTAYLEAERLVRDGVLGEPRLIRTFIWCLVHHGVQLHHGDSVGRALRDLWQ